MIRAALVLVFFLPLFASAHALGVSHEVTVDGIHIDIGYSSAAPVVGESVIFDFNLPAGEEDERYTDVWVRVNAENGSTKLATAVHNAGFGGPRMSYSFPEAGTYTISARYENEGTALAKTEWQITVLPDTGSGVGGMLADIHWLTALIGVFLGGAGAALYLRRAHIITLLGSRASSKA